MATEGLTFTQRMVIRVLERSSMPLLSKDIAALGDIPHKSVQNALTDLVRAGRAINATPEKAKFKRYKIAPIADVPKPAPIVAAAPTDDPASEIIIKLSRADYEAFQRIYKAITLEVWSDPVLGQYADAGGE